MQIHVIQLWVQEEYPKAPYKCPAASTLANHSHGQNNRDRYVAEENLDTGGPDTDGKTLELLLKDRRKSYFSQSHARRFSSQLAIAKSRPKHDADVLLWTTRLP